jgi:hypothetical protein
MLTASVREGSLAVAGRRAAARWRHGEEVVLAPSPARARQDVTAPLVFVGYGLHAPRYGIDDYRGIDVRGKIAVMVGDRSPGLPGEVSAVLMDRREQLAASRGAVGALLILEKLPARGRRVEPRTFWLDKNGSAVRPLPQAWVSGTVTPSVAKRLFEGSGRDVEAVMAEVEAQKGRPAPSRLKTRLRLQVSSDWKRFSAPQVLGMLKGGDPALKQEVVVLTAHLDGRGVDPAAAPGSDAIRNGTIDNAAGIAALIEVARSFAAGGPRPRRSILFFANTAEEKWLVGSSYYAANPIVPAHLITSVVNIDTPLITADFKDVIAFGAEHSTIGPVAARAIEQTGLAMIADPMPEQALFVRTDHYSFVEQGIPSIHLQVGYANGGEEQWKSYFASRYHRASDDMTQHIFWSAGPRFAELHHKLVRALADADRRPQWLRGSFLGDLFAPDRPKAPAPD